MRKSQYLLFLTLPLLLAVILQHAGNVPLLTELPPPGNSPTPAIQQSIITVDQAFADHWHQHDCTPAEPAQQLQVLRRLSLALCGTSPSLEEVRRFLDDPAEDRLARWTDAALRSPRFAYYFADRLARCLTGVEQGQLIIFRRDRLRDWLARQLLDDVPWPDMVRSLVAADGLWTDNPAVNYITVARGDDEVIDTNRLTARTVRVFLGQRIDCAQCHDHPFDQRWKQQDFTGLTAWYSGAGLALSGVTDNDTQLEDSPCVPFSSDWLPDHGTRRQRLAEWLVHPDNVRFERAIANRIWGLMTGRALIEPVDDLPHPDQPVPLPLVVLGQQFRENDSSLISLIRIIAGSQAMQQSSETSADDTLTRRLDKQNALFPLTRLRPEQVVGSIFQSSLVATIDQDSPPIVRFRRLIAETEFIREFGDIGEDELMEQGVTVSQTLLRMNGKLSRESTQAGLLTGPSQLLSFCSTDDSLIENAYLMCLTRYPDPQELEFFRRQLQSDPAESVDDDNQRQTHRQEATEDLFWTLMNSPEFIWNH